jgi:hypothetical protein
MNFADPTYWAPQTNLTELEQDQAIRDKVLLKEQERITNWLRDKKNSLYLDIATFRDNSDRLKTLVSHVLQWSGRNELPPNSVQVVTPFWDNDDRLIIGLRRHPEAWTEKEVQADREAQAEARVEFLRLMAEESSATAKVVKLAT